MVGNRNSGRRPKTVPQHRLENTLRKHRHEKAEGVPRLELPPKPPGRVRAGVRSQRPWIRQPLELVITNAGDDMQSICRKQHEKVRAILDGSLYDDSFFALIKSADPEDDWTDPAVWERANPELGHVISLADFTHDVQNAIQIPSEQPNFKRLRLGVWQQTANAWISLRDWDACREQFDDDDLAGRECFGGLDLSKTRDMTAFVLVFPMDDGTFRIRPEFWLPEDRAREMRETVPFEQWARDGFLNVTPGNWLDYTFCRKRIVELGEQFAIKGIAFDPWNADQFVQRLQEDDGLRVEPFRQSMENFTSPTKEFERLVLSGGMKHNGHPVLRWQVGHATVKSDANGNIRPVKPDDHRKIDGVVAGIMALSLGLSQPEVQSEPQLIVLNHRR